VLLRLIFIGFLVFLSFGLKAQLDSVKVVVNDNTTSKPFVYLGYGNLFRITPPEGDTSEYILESKGNRVSRQTWGTDHYDKEVFQIYVYKSRAIKVELYEKNNPSKRKVFYYKVVTLGEPIIYLGRTKIGDTCSRLATKLNVRTNNYNHEIVSFTMYVAGYLEMKAVGSKLNRKMRKALKKMKPGTVSFLIVCKSSIGYSIKLAAGFNVK
jgi:hypothetical protein